MTSLLQQYKEEIEAIISSINPLIGLEFSIVDENRTRFVGTGQYKQYIGLSLPENTAVDVSLRNKEPIWLANPLYDPVCMSCSIQMLCFKENAYIHPIILDERAIGAITIGAFTNEQKQQHRKQEVQLKYLVKFLAESISDMIDKQIQTARMDMLLQHIEEGVIMTNKLGEIILINHKLTQLFQREIEKDLLITTLIPKEHILLLLQDNEAFEQVKINLNRFYGDKELYLSGEKIQQGINEEYLFTIKEISSTEIEPSSVSVGFGVNIIGGSKAIEHAKHLARQAARVSSNVLIQGESGTGKELFAQYIHQQSDRSDKPFVAINCAAIPDNLMESELFGYEEGSFTGAKEGGKAGKFELANNGTLFLDEIGDLSLHLQPKLLRAIEYGHVERVGSTTHLNLNVRILAATNRPLEEMVKDGRFREDLYYRLNVIPLTVPPLKQRREDILILAHSILSECNKKFSTAIKGFSKKAEEALFLYDWPGNIRELVNAIEYAVHLEEQELIQELSLPGNIVENSALGQVSDDTELNIKQIEQMKISKLLTKYGMTLEGKKKVAEQLGISISTLYRRLKEE